MSDFKRIALNVQLLCLVALSFLALIAPVVVPMLFASCACVAFQMTLD